MRFFDYIRLAYRNLTRQKARTTLTIVAITVGSLSLILMMSIIVSIRSSLVDQFSKLGAFELVTVVKDPNSINTNSLLSGSNGDQSDGKMIDDAAVTSLRKIINVKSATPTITVNIGTAHLEGQTKKTWANLLGYDPATSVFDLPIKYGRALKSTDMDKIVIGSRIIEDYGFGSHPQDLIGQKLLLTTKNGGGSGPDWGPLPEKPPLNDKGDWGKNMTTIEIPAEIIGIADNGSMDDGQNYVNIAWARKLNTNVHWEYGDKNQNQDQKDYNSQPTWTLVKQDNFTQMGYSSVVLKVDDTSNLSKVVSSVQALGYGANTAQTMLDQINKILALIGAVLAVIGGISLFVAAIGIINTMIMATYERIREIGVMRACGATKGTIQRLFTFEAAMLGFWGGVFGVVISFGLGQIAKLLVNKFGAGLGNIPVSKIGSFPWWLVAGVLAFTTLIGLLAGLYPARKASKMNPVDALRYE